MSHHTEDLPVGLAQRLQHLADTQTAGSQPWPAVDVALRRAHRRRVTSVVTLAAASVLAVSAALTGLLPSGTTSQVAPPAGTGQPSPSLPLTMAAAGYDGPIGGSLANDTAWLQALRAHIVASTADEGMGAVRTPGDVRVLWAGDAGGSRWAVTLTHRRSGAWQEDLLSAGSGAAGTAMQILMSGSTDVIPGPGGDFVARFAPGQSSPVVFVRAPLADRVEIATSRRISATGAVTTTWRPLEKQGGMVWAGEPTPAELFLATYRIIGPGTETSSGGNGVNLPGPEAAAAAIAAPGTDRGSLDCASGQAKQAGASIREVPVIATSRRLSSRENLAATVLRSPDGGYLFGICDRRITGTRDRQSTGEADTISGVSAVPFASPDDVMVVTQSATAFQPRKLVVIAPADATQIEVGGVRAPVTNRLAIVPFTTGTGDTVTVTALRADGSVAATAQEAAHYESDSFEF